MTERLRLSLLLVWLPLAALARGVPYRFDYRAYGQILPVLTWNNGALTYVEMPDGIPVTGAFVGDRAARRFVPVRRSGRFFVIPAVARRTLLVTPGFNVALDYRGPIPHPAEMASQRRLGTDLVRLRSASRTLTVLLARADAVSPAYAASGRSATGVDADFATKSHAAGAQRVPDHPVPAGHGTLTLFANVYLPAGWTLHYDAPVSPLTPVHWSRARNFEAALGNLALAHGWRLACRRTHCTIEPSWVVRAGSTLRTVLAGWAQAADWTLVWKPRWDRRMAGGAVYYGSFRFAVTHYVRNLTHEQVSLRALFWHGNRTLEILPTGHLAGGIRTHG